MRIGQVALACEGGHVLEGGHMPRIFTPGVPYHVISRGSGQSVVFRDAVDYKMYLEALTEAKRRFQMRIYHYVLMPNHVHLLLCATQENGSAFMRFLNLKYAKYACARRKKIGHIWKNRFKNIPVESDAYLLACGNYIEMNPVRAGLAACAKDWPYSSHRYYLEGISDGLTDESPLYGILGKTSTERQSAYAKLVIATRR